MTDAIKMLIAEMQTRVAANNEVIDDDARPEKIRNVLIGVNDGYHWCLSRLGQLQHAEGYERMLAAVLARPADAN